MQSDKDLPYMKRQFALKYGHVREYWSKHLRDHIPAEISQFLDKYQKYKYAYKRATEEKKKNGDPVEIMYWLEVCDHYLLKCKQFPDLQNEKGLIDWADDYLLTYDDYLITDVDGIWSS